MDGVRVFYPLNQISETRSELLPTEEVLLSLSKAVRASSKCKNPFSVKLSCKGMRLTVRQKAQYNETIQRRAILEDNMNPTDV